MNIMYPPFFITPAGNHGTSYDAPGDALNEILHLTPAMPHALLLFTRFDALRTHAYTPSTPSALYLCKHSTRL